MSHDEIRAVGERVSNLKLNKRMWSSLVISLPHTVAWFLAKEVARIDAIRRNYWLQCIGG